MKYDFAVIGAGPAGYIAAKKAASAGKKVLLVEKSKLGGVCLNEGCVPSKTLLQAAKTYHHAKHGSIFGVEAEGVTFKRLADPEEIANTIYFCVANPVINGAIIHANLGQIES